MALRPSTRTYGQVKRTVRRLFGDEAGVQLEDLDIQRWVDDAQTAIVERNKVLKSVSTTSSVAGQAAYTFPSPLIVQVESITYDGSPLDNIEMHTAQEMIQGSDPQQEESGTPTSWYEWGGSFVLYPKPDAVKDITLYYTRYPTPITGDEAQLLDLPDKYFQAIVDYCLWKAYELDEDWQASQIKEGHFRVILEEQSEEEREAAHMTYPVVQTVW